MRWKPRDADAFTHALLAKLPLGEIWPRFRDTPLYRTVRGLAGVVERWAQRTARFLIVEAFPPRSSDLLPDWERVLGLPEPCLPAAQTLDERRAAVLEKLQRRPGSQSRAYFVDVARRLGYHQDEPSPHAVPAEVAFEAGRLNRVRIQEFRPVMCGVTECGNPEWRLAPPEMRFTWVVTVPGERLSWWRFSAAETGVDPHLTIARADDLECLLGRLKPLHTNLIFNYTGV